ncbi:Zn-dependent alcohol dehydrogenase [Paucisalibacillus sp. EB02]|uniref:zinc-dependent dehydrogenase n=1 Tax=Paucisalibacillus sp. EB02 TaxID=1347087 RepID=UPI0004B2B1FA|nr:Zn-dependent alcohol dehydrogenase [Paucisalibacillus sp. EB02]
MQAAVMYGKEDVRLEEVIKPDINENEILLQVKSVGICGTDLRIIKNGHQTISESSPRILGHEISGVIVEVGKNVSYYQDGMRVAVSPNVGCGVCDFCVAGDFHMCQDYTALGVQLDGGFAEYVRIPEAFIRNGNLVEIPTHVSFEEASINEPLSCVYNGLSVTEVKPGDVVLVIGAGPIGVMHALLAKLAGASKVIISNRSTHRLEICKELDDSFITVESAHLESTIQEHTNGKGVDVCIVAVSSPSAQEQAVELAGVYGKVNFFGGLPKGSEYIRINGNLLHYKQITLTGTTKANNSHFRETMKFISSGILDVNKLVSKHFSISQFEDAINYARSSKGLKAVISFE